MFALKKIECIKGKQTFYDLQVDGKWQLESYEKSLQKIYEKDYGSIIQLMQQIANLNSLPKNKFRDITPNKELVKEYEFKKGDLRVFAIKTEGGQIVVLGGYKNSQKADIKKFQELKKRYLKTLKK